MSHRIDIENAVSEVLEGAGVYLDTETEDTLLAVIYGWRDEALTDARRAAQPPDAEAATLRARLAAVEAWLSKHGHTDFGHEPWWVTDLRAALADTEDRAAPDSGGDSGEVGAP